MLHKIPNCLVQIDRKDYCNQLRIQGERKAGLQELWNTSEEYSAGLQTMQRRMMMQLGFLEREGCIRLDKVWNTPTNTELNRSGIPCS
jgi:hypothetical protein